MVLPIRELEAANTGSKGMGEFRRSQLRALVLDSGAVQCEQRLPEFGRHLLCLSDEPLGRHERCHQFKFAI